MAAGFEEGFEKGCDGGELCFAAAAIGPDDAVAVGRRGGGDVGAEGVPEVVHGAVVMGADGPVGDVEVEDVFDVPMEVCSIVRADMAQGLGGGIG